MRRTITVLTSLALALPLTACRDDDQDESAVERFEERAPAVQTPASTPVEPVVIGGDDSPGTLTWLSSRDALQEQMNARSERFAERRQELERRMEDDAAEDVREADNALNAAIYDFETLLSELAAVEREDFDAVGKRLRSAAQEVELRLMELSERINHDADIRDEMQPDPSPIAPSAPEGASNEPGATGSGDGVAAEGEATSPASSPASDESAQPDEELEATQPDGLAPMPQRASD